jgi:Leucine-rich repeat (LRR) protein
MPHLQWLDLSHNIISEMEFDTFRNIRKLQVLQLSHNNLMDLPTDIFRNVREMRVIDLSYNMFRSLNDNVFSSEGMEILDLSHNHFTKIPIASMSNIAAMTLCELDLSHNVISAIHSMDLSKQFRVCGYYIFTFKTAIKYIFQNFRVYCDWICPTIDWSN